MSLFQFLCPLFRTFQVASKSVRPLNDVPFAGVTLMIWQEYALLLVALTVLVAGITAVGLKKMKITGEVAVGLVVLVARVGVIVAVGVRVGTAAAVLVRAAFAVCTIRVPIVLGSIVGTTGAAAPGTQC